MPVYNVIQLTGVSDYLIWRVLDVYINAVKFADNLHALHTVKMDETSIAKGHDYITLFKHEDVYLKGYATMIELTVGLSEYFTFYNSECPHQSLGQKTPDVVYKTVIGGGAMIVNKSPRS